MARDVSSHQEVHAILGKAVAVLLYGAYCHPSRRFTDLPGAFYG